MQSELFFVADTPTVICSTNLQHISNTSVVLLIANLSITTRPNNTIKFTICRSTIPRLVGDTDVSGMINLVSHKALDTLSDGKSLGAMFEQSTNGSCPDQPGEGDYYYTIWGQIGYDDELISFYNSNIYVFSLLT